MSSLALVSEQAALRRVATLVAHGTPQERLFSAVIEEIGRLLAVEYAHMGRYEPDGGITFVASWGPVASVFRAGARGKIGGRNLVTKIFETGCPARFDSPDDASGPLGLAARDMGVRSAVGSPIVVEGDPWGVVIAGSTLDKELPPDTETRLASFTELVASAVASAESRAGLSRLLEEQAALRRVATLVAAGAPPEDLFASVVEEVGRLLPVDLVNMGRYESDSTQTYLATWARQGDRFPPGGGWPLGGRDIATLVFETGRPARIDAYSEVCAPLGEAIRRTGLRSAVGTPIIVEGRLWGQMIVGSCHDPPLPPDTEARLASFTELVATAIANAESRAALTASRARIVAAADESRRRIERDLHDGAQQRLVHAVIVLKLARRALSGGEPNAGELVAEALRHAEAANAELRELAHGILPSALSRGGLRAGVEALVSRVSLPVSVDVAVDRLPAVSEATAYFVISEALTNVVKHARARSAQIKVSVEAGELRIEVHDDGVGGASGGPGTGLGGLEDRVSALDGRFRLDSPPGGGTRVCARVPVPERTEPGSGYVRSGAFRR